MYNPLVSIIIPVYNGEKYMRDAIDSALSQTYENIEIIVINDGSKDKTEDIALSYGDKIRYYSKENGGVSTALNLGISKMNGEWFSWLSHDDVYNEKKIEIQINDVIKTKEIRPDYDRYMYYCAGGMMDADGNDKAYSPRKILNGYYEGNDILLEMFQGCNIGGCGLLIPKKMFDEVGTFDESMRYMQDMFMWEKAFITGYGLYANKEILVKNRVHSEQTSTTGAEYGLKDRKVVGIYLSEALCGLVSSDGKILLKVYMNLCMKCNNTEIGWRMYRILSERNQLNITDIIKTICWCCYGYVRKHIMIPIYYKLKYGVKR